MDGGAYGAGKAGAPFDPFTFLQRPQVILRALCLLFGIIVFGCISAEGWLYDKSVEREVCLYNRNSSACHFGEAIGLLAFFSSVAFLVGELLFQQMSSVKTRKHFVLGDLGASGLWALLNFICFCYLANQWSHSDTPENDYGVNNLQAAIVFSFFSIFTWAGCGWLAWQRWQQGAGTLFASGMEAEPGVGGAAYSSYSQDDQPYQDPPFSNQHGGGGEYPAPTY